MIVVCPTATPVTSVIVFSGPVGRMQVTSDGNYAAFTSKGRITGYDARRASL